MPSPFPGMDPYLEHPAYWSGFHSTLNIYIRSAITPQLPKGYYAEVEQHVWLQGNDPDGREPFAIPDGYVAGRETNDEHSTGDGGAATLVATAPSTEVTLATGKRKSKFVQIVDQPGNRVVTVIEVLSPANKTGEDRDAYLLKRDNYRLTGTSLVEVDLLMDGERLPMGKPKPPRADYYALVSRADRAPKASVWAFLLRDPLPNLPVPLKTADGEVVLNLRACLDRAYDDAGYQNRIDYAAPPAVSLRKPDAVWAAELLKTRKG